MACLRKQGIEVPKQVAVVGYDDHDICLGTYPSLTNNEVWYQPADLFRTVFMKDPIEKNLAQRRLSG